MMRTSPRVTSRENGEKEEEESFVVEGYLGCFVGWGHNLMSGLTTMSRIFNKVILMASHIFRHPWKENGKVLPVDQQKLRSQYFHLAKTKKHGANKTNLNQLRLISRALRYETSCFE